MSRSTTFMCVHACACTQSKSKACHLKQRHSETERALQSPAMGGEGALGRRKESVHFLHLSVCESSDDQPRACRLRQ